MGKKLLFLTRNFNRKDWHLFGGIKNVSIFWADKRVTTQCLYESFLLENMEMSIYNWSIAVLKYCNVFNEKFVIPSWLYSIQYSVHSNKNLFVILLIVEFQTSETLGLNGIFVFFFFTYPFFFPLILSALTLKYNCIYWFAQWHRHWSLFNWLYNITYIKRTIFKV